MSNDGLFHNNNQHLTEVARQGRLKAYCRLVRHAAALCGIVYELSTGEKPPKFTKALAGYNVLVRGEEEGL